MNTPCPLWDTNIYPLKESLYLIRSGFRAGRLRVGRESQKSKTVDMGQREYIRRILALDIFRSERQLMDVVSEG